MQSNSGATHQACASCKHQRKKCEPNCPLAPFFPSNYMEQFQAVHKVFGVSNTQKMIKNIDSQHEQHMAVKSIIWEAQCREADPVNGCLGKYIELQHEIDTLRDKNKMLQYENKMLMENNKMLMESNNMLQNDNTFLKNQFSQFQYNAENSLHTWSNNNNSLGVGNDNGNNGSIISDGNYIQPYAQGLQTVHPTEDPFLTYPHLMKQEEKRNSLTQLSRTQINQQQYQVVERLGLINLRTEMNADSDATTNMTRDTTTSGVKMINNPNWMR